MSHTLGSQDQKEQKYNVDGHMFDDDDPPSYLIVDAGNKADYMLNIQHIIEIQCIYGYQSIKEFKSSNNVIYANNYKKFIQELQKVLPKGLGSKDYQLYSIPKHAHWKNKKYDKLKEIKKKQKYKNKEEEKEKQNNKLNDYDYYQQQKHKSDYNYHVPHIKVYKTPISNQYSWDQYINYSLWWDQAPEFEVQLRVDPNCISEMPNKIHVTFNVRAKQLNGQIQESKIDYVDTDFGKYGKYETWDTNFTTYLLTVMFGYTAVEIIDQNIKLLKAEITTKATSNKVHVLTTKNWIKIFLEFYKSFRKWPSISLQIELMSKKQSQIIDLLSTFNLLSIKDKLFNLGDSLEDIVAIINVAGIESIAQQLTLSNDQKISLKNVIDLLSDTNENENNLSLVNESLESWLMDNNLCNYKDKINNMSLTVKDVIEWTHSNCDTFASQLEMNDSDKQNLQIAVLQHPYFQILESKSINTLSPSESARIAALNRYKPIQVQSDNVKVWLSCHGLLAYYDKINSLGLTDDKIIIEKGYYNFASFANQLNMNEIDKSKLQQAILTHPYFDSLQIEEKKNTDLISDNIMIISWLESNGLQTYKHKLISKNICSVDQLFDFAVIDLNGLINKIGINNKNDKDKFKQKIVSNPYYIQLKQAITMTIITNENEEKKEQKEEPIQMPVIPNDFFISKTLSFKQWIESLSDLLDIKTKALSYYNEWMYKLNDGQYIKSLIENNLKFEKKRLSINIKYDNKSFEFVFPYLNQTISANDIKKKLSLSTEYFNYDQLELLIENKVIENNTNNFIDVLIQNIKKINREEKDENKEEEKNNNFKYKFPNIELKWKALVIDLIIKDKPLNKSKNLNNNNSHDIMDNTALWTFLNQKYTQNFNTLKTVCSSTIQAARNSNDNELKIAIATLYNDHIAAIHLYTGSWLYRDFNKDLRNKNINKWKDYAFELTMGLKQLPFYWGKVFRGRRRHSADFETLYRKDNIICWDGFSSSSISESLAVNWAGGASNRNGVVFEINSWHGRHIEHLSAYKNEKEVLLMASSHFRVLKVERKQATFIKVFMEEVPMPWCQKAILWVDDRPKDNKKMMEDLEKDGIMVIPRTSTKNAIDLINYIKEILQRNFSHFRIVTDMSREENGGRNRIAGAELIKALRDRGYNNLVCIYCGNAQRAKEKCLSMNLNMDSILITTNPKKVLEFCRGVLLCVCSVSDGNQIELKKINKGNIDNNFDIICDECGKFIKNHNEDVHYCVKCEFVLCLLCSSKLIKVTQDPKLYDIQLWNVNQITNKILKEVNKYIITILPFHYIYDTLFNFQIGQKNIILESDSKSTMISIKENLGIIKQALIGKMIVLIHSNNNNINLNKTNINIQDVNKNGLIAKIKSVSILNVEQNKLVYQVDILKKTKIIKIKGFQIKCAVL